MTSLRLKVAISLYFIVFFLFLASLFALLLLFAAIALNYRDFSKYDSSLLGPPGLSVNPIVSFTARLIWLKKGENQSYLNKIKSLLEGYENVTCTNDKSCGFDIKRLGPCAVKPYGYGEKDDPFCVYFLVNKIFHWVPECHNDSLHLPINMPVDVKQNVQNLYALNPDTKLNCIWISCSGNSAFDRDKISHIEYYPYPGFDSMYFPYKKVSSTSPIVAVRFYGVAHKSLVTVRCHLFAKNIPEHYHSLFQVYIDRS